MLGIIIDMHYLMQINTINMIVELKKLKLGEVS